MAEIENIHCPICTQPIPSSWQNGLPPALATSVQRGAYPKVDLPTLKLVLWKAFNANSDKWVTARQLDKSIFTP